MMDGVDPYFSIKDYVIIIALSLKGIWFHLTEKLWIVLLTTRKSRDYSDSSKVHLTIVDQEETRKHVKRIYLKWKGNHTHAPNFRLCSLSMMKYWCKSIEEGNEMSELVGFKIEATLSSSLLLLLLLFLYFLLSNFPKCETGKWSSQYVRDFASFIPSFSIWLTLQ